MSANNASPDTPSNPTKDTATCPERDACKGAQDDSSEATQNNPPTSQGPTNGINAFLWWVGKTGRINEIDDLETGLAEHYKTWRQLSKSEQSELGDWR